MKNDKNPYEKPSLTVHGDAKEITQQGGQGFSDQPSGGEQEQGGSDIFNDDFNP